MKHTLSILAILIITATSMAQNYDFSAQAPSGQTLYYNINGDEVSLTYPGFYDRYHSDWYTGYSKPSGNLIIPDSVTFNGVTYAVTSIGDWAFVLCEDLQSVIIPNTITAIGKDALGGCYSISSLSIPNTVYTIGQEAFASCTSLVSITLPEYLTRIESGTFHSCNSLANISIPYGVSYIGSLAFYNCSSLTSITIPSAVHIIEYQAFLYCTNLTSIIVDSSNTRFDSRDNCNAIINTSNNSLVLGCRNTVIPNTVNHIGSCAFLGLTDISSITIPNSVISIGKYAFQNCHGLSSVSIGCDVQTIDEDAFDGCNNLTVLYYNARNMEFNKQIVFPYADITTLHIGDSVEVISNNAFKNCTTLTSISIPSNNRIAHIGTSAFEGCNQMAGHIVVPHIASLGSRAFYNCGLISSVELGNSIPTIGEKTFYGCDHLTNVTIGRGVTNIAPDAFSGCTEIQLITSRALNPPTIYSGTFADVNDNISVRVPCSSVAAYQNAAFWSHFDNIEGQFEYFFSATSGDITSGSVTIVHAPTCDDIQAHIQANPYHGYHFVQWSDGNTDNPRYIVVTQDTIITALFERDNSSIVDAADENIKLYQRDGKLVVEGADGLTVALYDAAGRQLAVRRNEGAPILFDVPASGTYLVKVGNAPARRIVVVK